jgi:transposase
LRSILKEAGVGQQGLSRSATDSARALLHVAVLQERHGFSYDAAIKTTAAAELSSPSTLRSAAQRYAASGVLPEPDTSQRGRGNPSHPLHHSQTDQFGPSFEAELLIHELVHSQKTEGTYVTSTVIRAELQQRLSIDVCRRTVRRWLCELGYRWRHKRYVGGMKPQARAVRIRQFIMEYAAALAEEAAGTAKIVYFDESYIHAHQASKKGWFQINDRDVIGDDKGKRIIILHAMTEDGLLAVPDAVASNWLSESALTAELVFDEVLEDGQDDADYHNTMNGAKIIAWLRNRLFPTFEHLYPGKKMYLVLDNATYHAPRDETWISTSKAQNKHNLAHQLLDLEVTELTTVDDSHRVVPAHLFEAKRSEGGPSKDDLLAAVRKFLAEHPDHNRTVIEQLMSDKGYSLIYTPPFCPEVQPIELLWAEVKRYVADRCHHKRSPEEARAQTEEGFAQVTYRFILNIIRHCHDWIDGFLTTEEAGDLRQCGTLASVIKWLPLLKAAGDSRPTVLTGTSTTQPMDISPPPPAPASAPAASSRTLRKRR